MFDCLEVEKIMQEVKLNWSQEESAVWDQIHQAGHMTQKLLPNDRYTCRGKNEILNQDCNETTL